MRHRTTTPCGCRRSDRRHERFAPIAALLALASFGAGHPALAEGGVTIVGDTLPDNPAHFRWTVTNESGANIVMFRAPRFLAETAIPPRGWTAEILKGTSERNGEVVFRADTPADGVFPSSHLDFEVQDTRRVRVGRTKRPLTVTVGRANGTEQKVVDVLCPTEESAFVRNLPMIGLGSMFVIFLAVQAARKRRRARSQAAPE